MRQRVCIAVALISDPEVVIADEPTTALDVTIQAQILNLVQRLARERDMAMIWVTHDLSVVAGLCDRVAVMYAGRIVEMGRTEDVLSGPRHPYTLGLINSIPADATPGDRLRQIAGSPPSPLALPSGCAFAPRCNRASERCKAVPEPTGVGPDHTVRCFHPVEAAP
jgi:peptide/nickel transport system ATP-binding protein